MQPQQLYHTKPWRNEQAHKCEIQLAVCHGCGRHRVADSTSIASARSLEIGFVSRNRSCPPQRGGRQIGFVSHLSSTRNLALSKPGRIGFVCTAGPASPGGERQAFLNPQSAIHPARVLTSFPFAFKSSIINRKSEGVPLPRGRVARIVTEFCAQTTPENGATPCAQRNNESFRSRGVLPFQLLHKREQTV